MNLPGLIMDKPLMVCSIIAHAARYHTATEIVARTAEGSLHRHTFGQAHDRSRQLAHAITRLGRQPGDRAGMPAATSLPGRNDEPDKLYGLPESERVTLTCGVPTFWLIIVGWLARNGKTFSTLRQSLPSGSAVPRSLMEKLARDLRVETLQTWGMTEALGGSSVLMAPFAVPRSVDGCIDDCMTSGRATWGVDYRLVDDAGQERPQDGASVGHFRIKAPWVSSAFFKNEGGSALDAPQMLAFMRGKGVDWWLPDDVVFVDQMLMTGTGKVHKLTLRQQFSTYLLPGAGLSG